MMSGTRSLCMLSNIHAGGNTETVRRLRLTLQTNPSDGRLDFQKQQKPVGRAYALIPPKLIQETPSWNSDNLKSGGDDEQVEIIKVYLKAKAEDKANHDQNVNRLKGEVHQIQEVRQSIEKLREQLSGKVNGIHKESSPSFINAKLSLDKKNGFSTRSLPSEHDVRSIVTLNSHQTDHDSQVEDFLYEDTDKMRETAKKLFARLQEAERRHITEKKALEDKVDVFQQELSDTCTALKESKDEVGKRDMKIEELQRLMGGMEKEHQSLLLKMKDSEVELEQLRKLKLDSSVHQDRSAKLEKEVAVLREKIHHLDDMLKSQQRKVRQMIEQLENSKTQIKEKDTLIQQLQEKVSFLEAENREMHDRMDHLLGSDMNLSVSSSSRPLLYSKRLQIPNGPIKNLPFIKLVET
ncbi:tuftelin [Protopterus annectens]|uniref:tuftelin n=1 Tax=Protopterus annectens TaxID=7888 RepID=UPI001CF9471C|nr:tuftelin [Protopterus annectens]